MFRPEDVGQIFGQDHLLDVLIHWCENISKIPQSVLFHGPYGIGKTSIARMIAKRITSLPDDLSEINAADARGIDDVRNWTESARFSPFGAGKVYIIDELHQMTHAAQSALLKVIEEPPEGIYFFLCTTNPSKLLPTIRSRCTSLELKLFKPDDTFNLLSFVFKNKLTPEVKQAIHLKTGGHARDAVKMGETAVLTGSVTVSDLTNEVGLGYTEIENLLRNYLKEGHYQKTASQIASIQDEGALATMLDRVVDEAMLAGNILVMRYYLDLLKARAMRVDWKITAHQHALYFLSRVDPKGESYDYEQDK